MWEVHKNARKEEKKSDGFIRGVMTDETIHYFFLFI